MPDRNSPEQEPRKNRPFIREKVASPPMTKKQLIGRMAALCLIAATGGTAAGISLAVARPLAERYLAEQTAQESVPVTIPKDDPDSLLTEKTSEEESAQAGEGTSGEEPAPEPDDGAEESAQTEPALETEAETEPLEVLVESIVDAHEFSAKDMEKLFRAFRKVAQQANKGIVEVHSVKHETDWFNNPVETAGLYAGAVIASTDQELLILTPVEAVKQADSIKVTFENGAEAGGSIKQTDAISGMAIVSVPVDQLDAETRKETIALTLGNSYSMRQGDLIAALGAPAGMVHSSSYGSISYVAKNVQVADGVTRLFYADVQSDAKAGTFLVNVSGEVVGWVTDEYREENRTDLTVAMAISDYKSMLEKMSNGQPVPYLGIRGQEVSAAMEEEGIPRGIYVAECIPEGPAYSAGIQNGDIVVRVGARDIVTVRDYQNQVEILNQDAVVTVVVQRKGIEEYKELEYQVTVGTR